jgi:hypothetical protein
LVECREVVAEGREAEPPAGGVEQVERLRRSAATGAARQAGERDAAVARDHGGHALAHLGHHQAVIEQQAVVMGMHVDETRRQREPGGVDGRRTAQRAGCRDRRDAIAFDRDIAGKARRTAAVEDRRVRDHQRRLALRGLSLHPAAPSPGS